MEICFRRKKWKRPLAKREFCSVQEGHRTIIFLSFLWPRCRQDLSSLTRDRTHVPRSGSTREVLELLSLTFSLVATFDILQLFAFIWSD